MTHWSKADLTRPMKFYSSGEAQDISVVLVVMSSILIFGYSTVELCTRVKGINNFQLLYRRINLCGAFLSSIVLYAIVNPLRKGSLRHNISSGSFLAKSEAFFLILTITGASLNLLGFLLSYLLFLKGHPTSVSATSDTRSPRSVEPDYPDNLTFSSSKT